MSTFWVHGNDQLIAELAFWGLLGLLYVVILAAWVLDEFRSSRARRRSS